MRLRMQLQLNCAVSSAILPWLLACGRSSIFFLERFGFSGCASFQMKSNSTIHYGAFLILTQSYFFKFLYMHCFFWALLPDTWVPLSYSFYILYNFVVIYFDIIFTFSGPQDPCVSHYFTISLFLSLSFSPCSLYSMSWSVFSFFSAQNYSTKMGLS